MPVIGGHCTKFKTDQSSCQALSPAQTEAILLASSCQHCWEFLRLFARGLNIAIFGLCIALLYFLTFIVSVLPNFDVCFDIILLQTLTNVKAILVSTMELALTESTVSNAVVHLNFLGNDVKQNRKIEVKIIIMDHV